MAVNFVVVVVVAGVPPLQLVYSDPCATHYRVYVRGKPYGRGCVDANDKV